MTASISRSGVGGRSRRDVRLGRGSAETRPARPLRSDNGGEFYRPAFSGACAGTRYRRRAGRRAQVIACAFLDEYNDLRPHSNLDYCARSEVRAELFRQAADGPKKVRPVSPPHLQLPTLSGRPTLASLCSGRKHPAIPHVPRAVGAPAATRVSRILGRRPVHRRGWCRVFGNWRHDGASGGLGR